MSIRYPALGVAVAMSAAAITALLAARIGSQHSILISKKPRLLSKPAPEFPEEGKLARLNASVKITGTIGEDGSLHNIVVVRGAGLGFDEKAIESGKRWRFSPAESKGHPLPAVISAIIQFHLPQENVPTGSLNFTLPHGAVRPTLVEGTTASLPFHQPSIDASLDVDTEGRIDHLRGRIDGDDLAALLVWRFTPARLSGQPVRVSGALHLYHTE